MITIFKYEIDTDDEIEILLPDKFEILTIQTQFNKPVLWAIVDTDTIKIKKHFCLYGTGHHVPADIFNQKYINTFQLDGGGLVFHLFEIIKEA